MAKDTKKTEAPKEDKKNKKNNLPPPKTAKDSFKYTVESLAEKLGVEKLTVRVKLRKAGIKKDGRFYGWNSKDAFEEVVKKLKSMKDEPKKAPKKDDEKPAKSKGKKAAAKEEPEEDEEEEEEEDGDE